MHELNPNPDTQISASKDTFILDRPFILTQGRTLITGMPYLYSEGNRTKAIRLLDVQEVQGIVYLRVEELKTLKTFRLSWNLNYTGDYWLWSIADLPTLMTLTK